MRHIKRSFIVFLLFLSLHIASQSISNYALKDTLTASDGKTNDFLGSAVSVSADGSTVLVGAKEVKVGANSYQGAAYIFTRSGTNWIQQKITADDGAAQRYFGHTVALSADGTTALIGAPSYDTAKDAAAYVFTQNGGIWTQQQKLVRADIVQVSSFGYSVALSADGNLALVGDEFTDSAYTFTRSGTVWTQQQKLTSTSVTSFGESVALSGDGSTVLINGFDTTIPSTYLISGYVFTFSNGLWTEQHKLLADDGTQPKFLISSAALNHDGSTAIIGAPFDDMGGNSNQGAAYIYARSGDVWTQQQRLTASDGAAEDLFGNAVSISADGNTALIGSAGDDIGANNQQGSAYIFSRTDSSWIQSQQLIMADGGLGSSLGAAVALSTDGAAAVVGEYGNDSGGIINRGAAYVFARKPQKPVLVSPAENAVIEANLSPEFSWQPNTDQVNSYRLIISDANNIVVVSSVFNPTDICDSTTCTVDLDSISETLGRGLHHWRVKATNNNGSSKTKKQPFTIVYPARPVLTSPVGGATTDSNTPSFTWAESAGAAEYRVRILKNGILVTTSGWLSAGTLCTDSVCMWTVTTPLQSGLHTWQVQARNKSVLPGKSKTTTTFNVP